MAIAANAVTAEGLVKRYGETDALAGFDLEVRRGQVVGLLGPNGAGKTTAIRILATLARLDGGTACVAGFDVATESARLRRHIGLVGQHSAVDDVLTGHQNLVLFGRLFHLGKAAARLRADQLLAQFDLEDAAGKQTKHYSRGMRRRLDLAASLVLAPEVLFLDEPTTGLDPRSRNQVWEAIRGLVDGGTTVVLTTQYLDEADQLADRVSVIDAGTVIAEGTPSELKSRVGGDQMELSIADRDQLVEAAEIVARIVGTPPTTDAEHARVRAPVHHRVTQLSDALRALEDADIAVADLELRRPTLDDVFLTLTGHHADDTTPTDDAEETAA